MRAEGPIDEALQGAQKAETVASDADKAALDADAAYTALENNLSDGAKLSVANLADTAKGGTSNTDIVKKVSDEWADDTAKGPIAVKGYLKALDEIEDPNDATKGQYKKLQIVEDALTGVAGNDAARKAIADARVHLDKAKSAGKERNLTLGGKLADFASAMANLATEYAEQITLWQKLSDDSAASDIAKRFAEGGASLAAFQDFLGAEKGGLVLWDATQPNVAVYAKKLGRELTTDQANAGMGLDKDGTDFDDVVGVFDKRLGCV